VAASDVPQFVAIGYPEQQATIEITCHDHSLIVCSRHMYSIWALFFAHITFVVNRTFHATPTERLRQIHTATDSRLVSHLRSRFFEEEPSSKTFCFTKKLKLPCVKYRLPRIIKKCFWSLMLFLVENKVMSDEAIVPGPRVGNHRSEISYEGKFWNKTLPKLLVLRILMRGMVKEPNEWHFYAMWNYISVSNLSNISWVLLRYGILSRFQILRNPRWLQ